MAGDVEARVIEDAGGATLEYHFGADRGRGHVTVRGGVETTVPDPGIFEHWLKERVRGCRGAADDRLRTFEVAHPPWAPRRIEFGSNATVLAPS